MFRNGEAAEAVRRKAEKGTLLAIPGGYSKAVTAVVRLWEERRAANAGRESYPVTISAPTDHDAHQISLALRERRRELGEVGANRMTIRATDGDTQAPRTHDMALAEGDRVRREPPPGTRLHRDLGWCGAGRHRWSSPSRR